MLSVLVNGIRLHERQLKICECYYDNMKRKKQPPTFEEIADKLRFYGTRIVSYHVGKLVDKGLLSRIHNGRNYRNYELTEIGVSCMGGNPHGVPVLGTTAAGEPYFILGEPGEIINLEDELKNDDIFAVHVRGNSMIGDHINDGDYAFIRRQSACDKGDIVVVSQIATRFEQGLEGFGYATLKHFVPKGGAIHLQSSNDEVEDIIIPRQQWDTEWRVEGKVIAVFRRTHSS